MKGEAAAAALLAIAAPAAGMPVSTFLSKVATLDSKAPADELTGQVAELKAELQRDAADLRAERLAATAAGETPAYCPPADVPQPQAEEIIAALQELPQQYRNIEVKDAIRAYLSARFPC